MLNLLIPITIKIDRLKAEKQILELRLDELQSQMSAESASSRHEVIGGRIGEGIKAEKFFSTLFF